LGSHGRAVVNDDESSVMGEQLSAFAAAPIEDAAGGAFDTLYTDLLREPLSAVPAT
jgi:hypothetical protein